MKEIGGYFEIEKNYGDEYHKNCICLNCARNCLSYVIEAYGIKKIFMPRFLGNSFVGVFKRLQVEFYNIDKNFKPVLNDITVDKDTYIYIVNYYGQISNQYLKSLKRKYNNIIVDNTQAFFQKPIEDVITLYSVRKYFGVADGAYLYCKKSIDMELPKESSCNRVAHIIGRFENTANEFYDFYKKNELSFENEEIKEMSEFTHNILRGIDYRLAYKKRTDNFKVLYEALANKNLLKLKCVKGEFMYPLYVENPDLIRKVMWENKIYTPVLWPNVIEECDSDSIEYKYANNIIPIPCDHRYDENDMRYIIEILNDLLNKSGD